MTRDEALKIAKPILFNTELIQAIQDGRKTVTRRVCHIKVNGNAIVNHKNCYVARYPERNKDGLCANFYSEEHYYRGCAKPPYKVGDILYVRETFFEYKGHYHYKADGKHTALDKLVGGSFFKWQPSIHMPKEAARIFLRVTDVRAERLRDIMKDPQGKNNQVVREGFTYGCDFIACWDNTIKKADIDKYGYYANPWVWVIEFERLEVTL